MSHSNHIKTLLDIQGSHIIFDDQGKVCKYIKGKLTYHPADHFAIYRRTRYLFVFENTAFYV
ncbi:hypothetical protein [Oceanobacillus neutriphilus]|uniref:Uncharacterized protein n=1 Tax=Oceanobacillus neutriphilus TaxID=531815 RepID=A0ABQ2P2B2_9BACI|nr:hypothetical protein [Oceanobacillus neutriphilus]GGP16306.1 hypothetical protein GCM10011346_47670 [Oceanobacillus neutriphilus]